MFREFDESSGRSCGRFVEVFVGFKLHDSF
jgi:hypothetical protein